MKKLLMMIGAAAFAVGAYADTYSYTGGAVSPTDGKVALLCNDGGAITNLTMASDSTDPMILTGDALDFAAGAVVNVIGNAVVSNTFTTAGTVSFTSITNDTWMSGTSADTVYLTETPQTIFRGVKLDDIVPLSGYGRRGTDVQFTDDFLYKVFHVVRDGDTMRFEMQLIHGSYTMGIFVELTQDGADITGRKLLSAYRNADKYGQQIFKYENGTASLNTTGTLYDSYKPKTLNFVRYVTSSTLTFAVSGTETLNGVTGRGGTVIFEGAGDNAKVRANGVNDMTNGAFIVKGDSSHPIVFDVAVKYALPTKIDCYGDATLLFSAAGDYNDGVAKGTDSIYMHEGSTLSDTNSHPFHYASGMVTLDGATMTHTTTKNAYLNFLTLTNGSTISLSSTGTFRGGFEVDSPTWTVSGTGRSTYNGNLTLIAEAPGTDSSTYKYLTIDVKDTVAGEGTDFLLAGNVLLDTNYKMASIVKTGVGTMELNGTLYTTRLPVYVTGGTLLLSKSSATSGVSFSLEGGTLALAAGTANTAATVAVSEDSSLAFGSGATLVLADLTIEEGKTLTLSGDVSSNGLKVNTSLDEAALGRIQFSGGRKARQVNGYIRPITGFIIAVF